MTTITFDTHAYIKRLPADGLPEKQAETIINVIRETQTSSLDGLATKRDIKELKLAMQLLKSELVIKPGAMMMALGGLLIAIKYLG